MSKSDPTQKYIRETCVALDGPYDREAVALLCAAGVFAAEDPTILHDAIDRLRDTPSDENDKIISLQETASKGATPEARRRAVIDLEEVTNERHNSAVDAAYLLGIAMGRRLGPAALRLTGGVR